MIPIRRAVGAALAVAVSVGPVAGVRPAVAADTAAATATITGRVVVPHAGFAITIAPGWSAPGIPTEAESGEFGPDLTVIDGPSSADPPPSLMVAAYPVPHSVEAADGPASWADFFSAFAVVPVARSEVALPVGRAIRLDAAVSGRGAIMLFAGGGASVQECRTQPAVHILDADFPLADAARVESDMLAMARSLELLPVVGQCGPADGPVWQMPTVEWSRVLWSGKYGDEVNDATFWRGGLVAVGHECPGRQPIGDRCAVSEDSVAWVSTDGRRWTRSLISQGTDPSGRVVSEAFGGLMVVEEHEEAATVYWSPDGLRWSVRSRIVGMGRCDDWTWANPIVWGLQRSGDTLLLRVSVCADGASIHRFYETVDGGFTWTLRPNDWDWDLSDTGEAGPPVEATTSTIDTGRWYVAEGSSDDYVSDWMWISPDGRRWRELPGPTDYVPITAMAGRGDLLVLFTLNPDGLDGWEIWLGRLNGGWPF